MKIDKLLQDFLFHCKFEKNLNQKTIAAYTIDIEQFKTFKDIQSMCIDKVDKDILKVHISEYSDSNAGVVPDTFAMRFSRL